VPIILSVDEFNGTIIVLDPNGICRLELELRKPGAFKSARTILLPARSATVIISGRLVANAGLD
jgi:hypothetical protein